MGSLCVLASRADDAIQMECVKLGTVIMSNRALNCKAILWNGFPDTQPALIHLGGLPPHCSKLATQTYPKSWF